MFKWLAERLYQRCTYCNEVHWKWVCFKCHKEAAAETIEALTLQLDIAVLNVGNPELIEKLAVMDGDECIGLVVPDSLEVIDNMGIVIPESFREKLRAESTRVESQ